MSKKYYLVVIYVILLSVILTFNSLTAIAYSQPIKVEISMAKTEFLVSEPIPVTTKITNISNETQKVEDIGSGKEIFAAGFELEKIVGNWTNEDYVWWVMTHIKLVGAPEPPPEALFHVFCGGPIAPMIDLTPGNSLTWAYDNILWEVNNEKISPGTYRIKAGFVNWDRQSPPPEAPIYSEPIEFTVTQSSAKLDIFLQGDALAYKNLKEETYLSKAPLKVKTKLTNVSPKTLTVAKPIKSNPKLFRYELTRLDNALSHQKPQIICPSSQAQVKSSKAKKLIIKPKQTIALGEATFTLAPTGQYKLKALLKIGDHYISSKPLIFSITKLPTEVSSE